MNCSLVRKCTPARPDYGKPTAMKPRGDNILSPAKLNLTLQSDFVRTELETGHKMLAMAIDQRSMEANDAANDSLDMARVALTGAERHLEAVNLPARETKGLYRDLRELRRQIQGFTGCRRAAAGARRRPKLIARSAY